MTMERMEIDENYIVRCLSGYETLLEDVRDRIRFLHSNMATTNDVLESLQMKKNYGTAGTSGGGRKKDLGDLLERYEENEERYAEFLKMYIYQLMQEEEALKRVWICYQGLPYRQRAVLKALYVEHKPWKVVRAEDVYKRQFVIITNRLLAKKFLKKHKKFLPEEMLIEERLERVAQREKNIVRCV